jgi:hypothetical protein
MSQKDGIWFCDVCDRSIEFGQKRFPLDGGRICCPPCWGEIHETTAKPSHPEKSVARLICDVCGLAIPTGHSYHNLPAGGTSCNNCWSVLSQRDYAPYRPAAVQVPIGSHVVIVGQGHGKVRRTSGLAVASLVLGILSLVTWYGGPVLGILALIFGAVASANISRNRNLSGNGMAVAGLVMGLIGTLFWLVILLFVSAALFSVR